MTKGRAWRAEHGNWDDASLVGAVLAGDQHAAVELYARYDPYARRVAARCTSTATEAAEAAAAGWASAFEKLSTLRNPDRFGPWLAVIVRNSAVALQRASSREVLSPEVPEGWSVSGGDDGSDEDRLERARAALLSLSKRDRRALELSVYEQLPVAEVAASLMIDVNTAYQVLSRARRRVRKAYLTPTLADHEPAVCKTCAARTADYVRGQQEVRAAVDAHVDECPECRGRLAAVLADAARIKGPFGLALPVLVGMGRLWRWPRRFFKALRDRAPVQVAVGVATVILAAGLLAGLSLASSSGRPMRGPTDAAPAPASKILLPADPSPSPPTTPARPAEPVVTTPPVLAAGRSVLLRDALVAAPAPPPTTLGSSPVSVPSVVPASAPTTVAPAPTTTTTTTTTTPTTTNPGRALGRRSPKPGRRIGKGRAPG